MIGFNEMQEMTIPGLNGGTGEMSAEMHISPKGSQHSIINTGDEDLVMLTIVAERDDDK